MTESSSTPETSTASSNSSTEAAGNKGPFKSLEELKANPVANDHYKPFAVTDPAGETRYVYARDYNGAIATVARADGWTARTAEPKGTGPLTKERVAAKLAELSDEELAALGLTRKKGRK
jgi:hypothetical protein